MCETGHLIGDNGYNVNGIDSNGKHTSTPLATYSNNLMGALGPVPTDSRNMDVIVSNPQSVFQHEPPSADILGPIVKIAARGFLSAIIASSGLCGGGDVSMAADGPAHQSRYIYCNVYLDRTCFGIAGGDSMNMNLPADFTLYSVTLATGPKALIYWGYNPQDDVFNSPERKECKTKDKSGKCRYIRSKDAFDLLYAADAKSPYVHIHLTDLSPSNAVDIQDFLGNFRACKTADQSVICSDERIFKGVVP